MRLAAGQAAFASALLDPTAPLPGNVVSARGPGDPVRFAVYRNNVFVSLTSALSKRFPVTARLVGDEFFTGMARIYAGIEKPQTPLMFQYGDSFPDFISGFEPAASLPYLADVARIEAAWSRAYHAADMSPAGIADLARISPPDLPAISFAAHPSASIISSIYPVGSIWQAHQNADVTPLRAASAEAVLITRPEEQVLVRIVPPGDVAFASALLKGQSLGEAAAIALALDSTFDSGAALVGLLTLGCFGSMRSGKGNPL